MTDKWNGFVIAHRETGDYIGQIDFVTLDEKNGWGELGMVIGKEGRDQGYGTEALEAMLRFGFQELRLNRIELVCWGGNSRACHTYEKVGFVQEGVRRQKYFRDGSFHDELCYGILAKDWQERQRFS